MLSYFFSLFTTNGEFWIAFYVVFACFILMWYKGKLPTTEELQDLTTILNSRGGNILILIGAAVFFFYRAERMYYNIMQMIKDGTIGADNGIALNSLAFDTGAFGLAFGAALKVMSPEATSPPSSTSMKTTTISSTITKPPQTPANGEVNITNTTTIPSVTAADAAKTVVDATKTAVDVTNPPQTS